MSAEHTMSLLCAVRKRLCPLLSRLDVLKTALKAANNKIQELHHALAAQSQLQVRHMSCTL